MRPSLGALPRIAIGGCIAVAIGCSRSSTPTHPRVLAAVQIAVEDRANWTQRLLKLMGRRLESPGAKPQALSTMVAPKGTTIYAFWATYCPPCLEEVPMFNRLHEAGHRIVGVALDGDLTDVQSAAKKWGFRYSILVLEKKSIARTGRALKSGLPFTVIVDSTGQVTQGWNGKLEYETLQAAL